MSCLLYLLYCCSSFCTDLICSEPVLRALFSDCHISLSGHIDRSPIRTHQSPKKSNSSFFKVNCEYYRDLVQAGCSFAAANADIFFFVVHEIVI